MTISDERTVVDSHVVTDLRPLLAYLKSNKSAQGKEAYGALSKFQDACSAYNDLSFAYELMLLLDKDDSGASMPAVLRGTILNSAILNYIRATEPSPGRNGQGRKHLNVRSKLELREQEVHDRLKNVRNKVIAHLDANRAYKDKSLAEEVLVLIQFHDGTARLSLADRRVVAQLDVEADVRALVNSALAVGNEIRQTRHVDALEKLSALNAVDGRSNDLTILHPFDSVAFCGSEEEAARFILTGEPRSEPLGGGTFYDHWPNYDMPK